MSHIRAKFDTARESHGQQRLTGARPEKARPTPRVPHVAKLMALAIRLEDLLETGQVRDQAELARLGRVSPARLTQIMNLLHLAPNIQEQVLSLPETARGRDSVFEREGIIGFRVFRHQALDVGANETIHRSSECLAGLYPSRSTRTWWSTLETAGTSSISPSGPVGWREDAHVPMPSHHSLIETHADPA